MQNEKGKITSNNSKSYDVKQRTFQFSLDLIELIKEFPKDYIGEIIGKQLLRCGTSIGANISEAQAASSKKDFAKFYNIALKSGNETKYWLEITRVSFHLENVASLLQETQELCNILGKSLITMRGK